MENIIGGIFPNDNKDMELDSDAMYMPITVNGIPIGFISGVSDKAVTACFWTKNWSEVRDENGKLLQIEIMDPNIGMDEEEVWGI